MTPDRRASLARQLLPMARLLAAIAVVGALLFAIAAVALADSPAPAASGGPGGTGAPGASGGPAISIIGTTFQPADLTIQAGQTVTWTVTQAAGSAHSVTSGLSTDTKPGTVFDSGIKLQNNGDSFSFTFASAGSYPYFCAVHPDTMHGTITVEAAAGGPQAGSDVGTGKLVTAAILVVAIVLLFGWARVYRRMNPA